MAKDLVSSLGEKNANLNELLQRNGCLDFNSAYSFKDDTGSFAQTRDTLLSEVREIVDMMDKLCTAQKNDRKSTK